MAEAVFEEMNTKLGEQGGSLVKKVNAIYEWKIGGNSWTMDVKTGPKGFIKKGAPAKADCTLTLDEPAFLKIVSGKLNAQQAFMQGQLKIGGNMMFAMKLGQVLPKPGSNL